MAMKSNKRTVKSVQADIKEMIATLREQRKSWKESAKAASKKGDRVTINFDGFIDEEAFEGVKVKITR